MHAWTLILAMVLAPLAAPPTARAAVPDVNPAAIGFDQRLDAPLPAQARFTDDDGQPIRLAEALGGKPAVLVLNYYDCPNLCAVTLQALFDSLPRLGLQAGRDFRIVAVSIDPRERPALAAAKKAAYLQRHPGTADASAVHFLTGEADEIARLTAQVGLRYVYDAGLDQYAHASGLVVVTPDGRIARYLFGARFPAYELRLALVDASDNRIGSLADRVWLLCYHYDPVRGRYGSAIQSALRAMGAACVLALGGGVLAMLARERRARPRTPS